MSKIAILIFALVLCFPGFAMIKPDSAQEKGKAVSSRLPSNLNMLFISRTIEKSDAKKSIREVVHAVNTGKDVDNIFLSVVNKTKNLDEVWKISKQISLKENENGELFIFSGGIANTDKPIDVDKSVNPGKKATGIPRIGGGILQAYRPLRDSIIPGNCVAFDYPDTREFLSFGQDPEKECLKTIYNEALQNNARKIVLVGLCRGAKTGLALAAEKVQNLSAMILESPMLSLQSVAQQFGKSYLLGIPGSGALIYNTFKMYFPSYQPDKENLLDIVKNIPADVPILFAHLKHDLVIPDEDIQKLVEQFKERKNVYLSVIEDQTNTIRHGTLSSTMPFQRVCNAFLAAYGNSHNPILAQEGKELLDMAHSNIVRDSKHWVVAKHT